MLFLEALLTETLVSWQRSSLRLHLETSSNSVSMKVARSLHLLDICCFAESTSIDCWIIYGLIQYTMLVTITLLLTWFKRMWISDFMALLSFKTLSDIWIHERSRGKNTSGFDGPWNHVHWSDSVFLIKGRELIRTLYRNFNL